MRRRGDVEPDRVGKGTSLRGGRAQKLRLHPRFEQKRLGWVKGKLTSTRMKGGKGEDCC